MSNTCSLSVSVTQQVRPLQPSEELFPLDRTFSSSVQMMQKVQFQQDFFSGRSLGKASVLDPDILDCDSLRSERSDADDVSALCFCGSCLLPGQCVLAKRINKHPPPPTAD